MKATFVNLAGRALNKAKRFLMGSEAVQQSIQSKIDDRWSQESTGRGNARGVRTRWWQSQAIRAHINQRVYDSKRGVGFLSAAEHRYKILPAKKGVSIGCGNGAKEIALVERGLVEEFDLYDLSQARIVEGRERARRKGVENKVRFHQANVFELDVPSSSFDLVYWDNSLHHMLDVDQAIAWSHRVLKHQGGLIMDDFVGATRFQWSDKQLEVASRVRKAFQNTTYLKNPRDESKVLSSVVKRPTVSGMIADDPSEAADSDKIFPSLKKYFPSVSVIPTGGAVYHLALNDMLGNFDEVEDSAYLELMLLIDDLMSDLGEYQYGVAFAKKQ